MEKRGELTINYVIVIILALLVLVVIALIFRNQIIDFINNIRGISSSLNTDLSKASDALAP